MTVRKPTENALAFLQGTIPGATSPNGQAVQARAVFGGVAPARPVSWCPCPGRTARIAKSLPDKALARLRMFRGSVNCVSLADQTCFGAAFSPKQRARNVSLARRQPARCGRGHDDSANVGRCDGGNRHMIPALAVRVVVAAHSVPIPDNPASFRHG